MFSISTGTPSASDSAGASGRASRSTPPPAGNGTITRTGLSGKVFAWIAGAASASGLAIGSSAIALGWNLVFNMLFERWERRQPTRGRSVARRVAHAIGFEGGLLLFLVPFFAWWLGVSLWQALVLDIGFLLFFLVYNFVFAWAFDRLFGLPAGVG